MKKINSFIDEIKNETLKLEPGRPYSVDQLKAFLICDYSLSDIFALGVPYQYHDDLEKFDLKVQDEKREWRDTLNDAEEAEERITPSTPPAKKIALLKKAIGYYKLYLQKYEDNYKRDEEYFVEKNVCRAIREIERLEREIEGTIPEIFNPLFEDMEAHPWIYLPQQMKYLFNGAPDNYIKSLSETRDNWPIGKKILNEFIISENRITIDQLKEKGIIPETFTQKNLCDPDYGVEQPTIDKLGEYPVDRTDIFFLGVPRSGKSSALAGILYKMHHDGQARYVPQLKNQIDVTQQYKTGLLNCIVNRKCPVSTDNDAICFMKFDIRRDRNRINEVNFVEMSGETFEKMSVGTGSEEIRRIWEERGAKRCLDAPNKKLLFLVIDYAVTKDINTEWDGGAFQQSTLLENAITSFFHDGTGRDGKEGCTMSKVKSIAFIMTKCDLMPNADSWDRRKAVAEDYINKNFQSIIGLLNDAHSKYNVNVRDSKDKINVIPFSLGKFYIGNTYAYDDYDSGVVVDFVKQTLDSRGGFLGWIF